MQKELISIIIPTLNEDAQIGATLESVAVQQSPVEVIVADGGSTDRTRQVVSEMAPSLPFDLRLVDTARSRAIQMNAGAKAAKGSILWFVHADTRPTPACAAHIREALGDPRVVGGCFRLRFDEDGFWMRVYQWRIWSRTRLLAFGDRTQFVRATAFRAIGGYPEQPLFEDVEMMRSLSRRGDLVFLDDRVDTSARRFRRGGIVGQQVLNGVLMLGWLMRVPPERLKRYYSDVAGERD